MLGKVSLSALFASRQLNEPLERNRRPRKNFAPPLRIFQVEPVVAHRLPHSPILAQLRPTVLRGTASLHFQRYPLGFGYRGCDLRGSRLLLPHGSVAPDCSLPYSPAAWVSFAGLPSAL